MRKRILCLMLCLAVMLPVGSRALAAETEAVSYFLVDGVPY